MYPMRDYVTCVEACVSILPNQFLFRLNLKYTTIWQAQNANTKISCDPWLDEVVAQSNDANT